MLGLTAGEIDCPFLSEAVEGGCAALQVGCSDHTVCPKLPWMVLGLVPSLSTGIVSSARSGPHPCTSCTARTYWSICGRKWISPQRQIMMMEPLNLLDPAGNFCEVFEALEE